MIEIPSGIFSINRLRRAAYSSFVKWAAKSGEPSRNTPKAIMNKNRARLFIATSLLIPYHADIKKASRTQDSKKALLLQSGFNFDLFFAKIIDIILNLLTVFSDIILITIRELGDQVSRYRFRRGKWVNYRSWRLKE
jgi:hypothetical protein